MDKHKTDESVKAGLKFSANTKPGDEETEKLTPVNKTAMDGDELVHEEEPEIPPEVPVDEEIDPDELVHEQPVATDTPVADQEQDIDDLIHQKNDGTEL